MVVAWTARYQSACQYDRCLTTKLKLARDDALCTLTQLFPGKVSVALHHLELMCVHEKAQFQIHVDTTDNAELAVSVTGPRKDVPVQVR